jgi:hypothetical protein
MEEAGRMWPGIRSTIPTEGRWEIQMEKGLVLIPE